MTKTSRTISLAAVGIFTLYSQGCATVHSNTASAPEDVPVVTIRILGATVGPFHADGTPWDGGGKASQESIQQLRSALSSANPSVAVVSFLAGPLFAGTDKPDACGTAELRDRADRVGDPQTLLACKAWLEPRNTFTPVWPNPAEWKSVQLTQDTSLFVDLEEFDTALDGGRVFDGTEPMGQMSITYKVLVEALRAKKVYPVAVGDQTDNQVLFIKIEVLEE